MIISKIKHLLFGRISNLYIWYLRNILGVHIGKNCVISRKARLDKINPSGIHIGNNVWILSMAALLSHDHSRTLIKPNINNSQICIGDNSIIGIKAMILPDVIIGTHCIVAAAAIVTKNIPDGCLVAGNPAKIIRRHIRVNNNGQIIDYGKKENE